MIVRWLLDAALAVLSWFLDLFSALPTWTLPTSLSLVVPVPFLGAVGVGQMNDWIGTAIVVALVAGRWSLVASR